MALEVDILAKGKYRLMSPLVYKTIVIPIGYVWDGASVPWFATPIIPRLYGTMRASCVHDYLCGKARNADERKRADEIFRAILIEDGMSKFRAYLGYLGVRAGATLGVGVRYPHWTDKLNYRYWY